MAVNITCEIQLCSLLGSRRKARRGNKVRGNVGTLASGPEPVKTTVMQSNYMGLKKPIVFIFLKRNKTKPSCFPIPLTSESSLLFRTLPGEIPVTGTESNTSHMPETSHGGISVADHRADHGEQGECSSVGEL